jgi:hypothetical protein
MLGVSVWGDSSADVATAANTGKFFVVAQWKKAKSWSSLCFTMGCSWNKVT